MSGDGIFAEWVNTEKRLAEGRGKQSARDWHPSFPRNCSDVNNTSPGRRKGELPQYFPPVAGTDPDLLASQFRAKQPSPPRERLGDRTSASTYGWWFRDPDRRWLPSMPAFTSPRRPKPRQLTPRFESVMPFSR
eukprot:TRINITY_DN5567_c0_g1_i1.p1 TRINITY_DN5567_c0_g1~~TRINITY_DN5567_c0_g1_i1.p1  ORF type:complete len:134 (+),score=8.56 TRINITY_DN5567_c0_g1_i1:64-465(+)